MPTYGSPEKQQVNEGFSVRDAHRHNSVPSSRPDQRVYVGFLPESPEAARGELWHIHLKGGDGVVAWCQAFGPDTPARAIAGFLSALITFPNRYCGCT